MAALVLGEQVVTLLPVPHTGLAREDVALAMRQSPSYSRLLDSWRWSIPLWLESVVVSLHDGADAMDQVRAASRRVAVEDGWAALKPFMHHKIFEGGPPIEFLDRLSADLLKGGPDPGFSLPVASGLDAFALSCGLIPARAGASVTSASASGLGGGGGGFGVPAGATVRTASTAQRAERRLGQTVFSLAIPIFTQAGAKTLLHLRSALAGELGALRRAMQNAADAQAGVGGEAAFPTLVDQIRRAGRAYAAAFADFASDLVGHDDDEQRQVLDGFVRVEGQRLPADAALISALAAWRQVRPASAARPARGAPPVAPPPKIFSLMIEPMSLRPEEGGRTRTAQAGEPQ